MEPAFMLGDLDPANRFAMEGLNMPFAAELHRNGKPLPKLLFIDIMVEKTQKLIEHINHHHLGLSLTANIGENSAIIKMYDNYATVNSQLLHVTISNLWDLEMQLWRLLIKVNGVIHDFIPQLKLKLKFLVYSVLEPAVGYLTTLHSNSQQGTHPTLV